MVLPREGEPGLFVSHSAPTLGHQDGPTGGGAVSLRLQPIAQPTSGADTLYTLPPIDSSQRQLGRSYSFGPGREADDNSFDPRLDSRVDSLTEKTFLKYSVEAGEQQEKLKFHTPSGNAAAFANTMPQRPRGGTQELTSKVCRSSRLYMYESALTDSQRSHSDFHTRTHTLRLRTSYTLRTLRMISL